MTDAFAEHERLSEQYALAIALGPMDHAVEDDLLERINDLWLKMAPAERAMVEAEVRALREAAEAPDLNLVDARPSGSQPVFRQLAG